MKLIVALEGQDYEADVNGIEVFNSLQKALFSYKDKFTTINIRTTSNAVADLQKLRNYEQKLIKDKCLIFERPGGLCQYD